MSTADVILEVLAERKAQNEKWGHRSLHTVMYQKRAIVVLAEELGEAARAILEGEPSQYRVELVQLAAVAVAAVEACDDAQASPPKDAKS